MTFDITKEQLLWIYSIFTYLEILILPSATNIFQYIFEDDHLMAIWNKIWWKKTFEKDHFLRKFQFFGENHNFFVQNIPQNILDMVKWSNFHSLQLIKNKHFPRNSLYLWIIWTGCVKSVVFRRVTRKQIHFLIFQNQNEI